VLIGTNSSLGYCLASASKIDQNPKRQYRANSI
jgi:hypothetical protein